MELEELFRKFISNIEPSETHRKEAIAGHKTLRERLESDEQVSGNLREIFLSGSYRRHTAVKPIKDVDIFVVLNAEEGSARKTLQWLEKTLGRVGYKTKTEPQRRSIRVDLSYVTMDVVPSLAPDGLERVLKIPSRHEDKWISSHPKKHIDYTTDQNQQSCDERFVPTIKIMKWWRSYQMPKVKHPKGFFLECLCGEHMNLKSKSYARAFVSILEGMYAIYGKTPAPVPIISDPGLPQQSITTGMTSAEFSNFMNLIRKCLPKAKAALAADTVKESVALWQEVFGPEFPESDDTRGVEREAVRVGPTVIKNPSKPWCV